MYVGLSPPSPPTSKKQRTTEERAMRICGIQSDLSLPRAQRQRAKGHTSKDVNIDRLVELISALSGMDIIEIRDKKTTFSKIADLATLVKKQLPDMDGKK